MDLFTYLESIEKTEPKKVQKKVEKIEPKIFSVLEISRKIKNILEINLSSCWIEGELSNYKKHSSGHRYFSLKDANAVINCVMWKGAASKLPINLENGMKLKVYGKISVYEASGRYQIDVKKVELAGIGSLQIKFEQLKKKLQEEGLFDQSRKRRLPFFAKNIGVVSAATGAAFQDIIKVTKSRSPFVNIYLYNARVQGNGAAAEIAKGIEELNQRLPFLDLIIEGRGGGSIEDLWPFNEEIVARAIYNSKIPIISAVGHEIDFCISDFTADVRAATPSHGAEIATIDKKEQVQILGQFDNRIKSAFNKYFEKHHDFLSTIENSYAFKKPLEIIKNYSMKLDFLEDKFVSQQKIFFKEENNKLNLLESMLKSLGPDSVLNRGYAIISKNSSIVDTIEKVNSGDNIKIKLHNGEFDSVVK